MQESNNANLPDQQAIDQVCDVFEKAWQHGEDPEIIDFIGDVPAGVKAALVRELILLDCDYREKSNTLLSERDYLEQLPEFGNVVRQVWLEREDKFSTVVGETLDGRTLRSNIDSRRVVSPGERVQYFGDYELLEELARGGMGVFYRAKQLSLNRVIALKMILSGSIAGEQEIRRFQREAEAAANLDHPSIVPIYDIGQHKGQHYFSMKLIEGGTLGSLSEELKSDHYKVVELVAKIADAVHHAHQRGILHRDLKPANILLDAEGQPLITDFGLARNTKSDLQLTQTGAIVGTPGFMPPEQAAGKGITTAADIYALGAILYHLLCGRPPHQGESVMGTLMSVINEPPPKPRDLNPKIHPDLELICMKCLAKETSERYTSAGEFAGDLRAFVAGEPLHVRAPSIVELVRMWLSSNFGNVLWIPLIALAVGMLAGFSLWVCTIGQDLAFYRHTYDKFPISERSFLAINWKPLGYPMFVVFVISLSVIGWLTARLTQTKNRTADIGAGLAVGLLSGLVAFASGMGSVLVESNMGTVKQDAELLFQIAATSNAADSYAQQRLATRYPTLQSLPSVERTSALSMKIAADREVGSFIGTAIGTLVCLIWFGSLGLGQSCVAGPLRREFSFWHGVLYYLCFSIALTSILFTIGTEVTGWIISGSGFILDWEVPILCVVTGVLVAVAVIARWPWPALLTITTVWLVAFALFIEVFVSAPMPRIAGARTEIKVAQRLVDAEPTRRDYQMRLARAHHEFAGVLIEFRTPKHDQRALSEYRKAIAAIERKPVQDFYFEETVLHAQLLGDASVVALRLGEDEQAARWTALHSQQYSSTPKLLDMYAKSVFASKRPMVEFLAPTTATNLNAWYRLATQLRALATYKDAHAAPEEPRSDQWLGGVVEEVLERTSETSADPEWPAHRKLLASWLTSRSDWELFGPYPIDPTTNETVLDVAYGAEEQLIVGKVVGKPDKVMSVLTGAKVDLLAAFASGNDVTVLENVIGYARTSFYLDEPQRIRFRFGSDDGIKVWIDDKVLLRNSVRRSVFEGNDIVDLNEPLAAGLHTLVFKINQSNGEWGFAFSAAQIDDWPLVLGPQPKDGEAESEDVTPAASETAP
jgi:eukaryotic-like serine/threonine-protein kinase